MSSKINKIFEFEKINSSNTSNLNSIAWELSKSSNSSCLINSSTISKFKPVEKNEKNQINSKTLKKLNEKQISLNNQNNTPIPTGFRDFIPGHIDYFSNSKSNSGNTNKFLDENDYLDDELDYDTK